MKNILLSFIFIFVIRIAKSQDIILMKNGDEVKSKVLEINDNIIKYKKTENPDGPAYSVQKTDVLMIKYANGTKDIFSNEKQPAAPANASIQTKTSEKKGGSFIKYTNLTQLGFGFGVGGYTITFYDPFYGNRNENYENLTDMVRMSTINGIRIGSRFSTAIGTGLDYYFYRGSHSLSVPVYLDLRFNILGDRVTPVVFFDVGNSFKTNHSEGYNFNGLLIEPGFGIKVPADDVALNFSFSYMIQKSSYSYYSYYSYPGTTYSSLSFKFLTFKIGISF
jgi:hypothetical protein